MSKRNCIPHTILKQNGNGLEAACECNLGVDRMLGNAFGSSVGQSAAEANDNVHVKFDFAMRIGEYAGMSSQYEKNTQKGGK